MIWYSSPGIAGTSPLSKTLSQAPAVMRIDASGYRRTPWKNGGGVTIDIADEYRPGAEPGGWAGMVWRLGRTRIEVPAPFSDLSGNDRLLAVIGGRGLVLRRPDGTCLDVREPFRPVAFPGEWEIRSELNEGPVEVLNLMGARDRVRLDLRLVGAGEACPLCTTSIVFAPAGHAGLSLAGDALALADGDALRLSGRGDLGLQVESGIVAVAGIEPI